MNSQTQAADMTNGQLYVEWNEWVWARLRGERISDAQQSRLSAIEAELTKRPAEEE